MVPAGVVSRFKSSEIDFRIATFIAGDRENVVGGYIDANVAEPAVEAVAECIAESHCGELEIAAVFEITVGRIVCKTIGGELLIAHGCEHVFTLRYCTDIGEVSAGFVEYLLTGGISIQL